MTVSSPELDVQDLIPEQTEDQLAKLDRETHMVEAAQAGDFEPLVPVIERVYPKVFSHMTRCHPGSAEDLTGDVIVRAMCRVGSQYTPGSNIDAWFMRIATTTAIDVARRKRRIRFDLTEDMSDVSDDAARYGRGPQPIDEQVVEEDSLSAVISTLPQEFQGVAREVIAGGSSYEDYANKHHVLVSTVASRVHRAKERLRNHYIAVGHPAAKKWVEKNS